MKNEQNAVLNNEQDPVFNNDQNADFFNDQNPVFGKDQNATFFKAMMTGLFIGIIDTIVCLAYNIGYRDATGYLPSTIVNVSSLIFAIVLLSAVIGIVFYLFHRFIRGGDTIYFIVFLTLTAWLTGKTFAAVRFGDPHLDSGWHGLMGGIVLIVGLSSACLPFFFRSSKFQEVII